MRIYKAVHNAIVIKTIPASATKPKRVSAEFYSVKGSKRVYSETDHETALLFFLKELREDYLARKTLFNPESFTFYGSQCSDTCTTWAPMAHIGGR